MSIIPGRKTEGRRRHSIESQAGNLVELSVVDESQSDGAKLIKLRPLPRSPRHEMFLSEDAGESETSSVNWKYDQVSGRSMLKLVKVKRSPHEHVDNFYECALFPSICPFVSLDFSFSCSLFFVFSISRNSTN